MTARRGSLVLVIVMLAVGGGPARAGKGDKRSASTRMESDSVKRAAASSEAHGHPPADTGGLGRGAETHGAETHGAEAHGTETARTSDGEGSALRRAASEAGGSALRRSARDNQFRGTFPREGGSAFSARGVHAKDTSYPTDPKEFVEKQGEFAKHLYETTPRPAMTDRFTDAVRKADPKSPSAERLAAAGGSLAGAGVSRNHRLADSALKGLLVTAIITLHNELRATGTVDARKVDALKNLCKEVGAPEAFKTLEAIYSDPKMLEDVHRAQAPFAHALAELSVNTTNVRLGDAAINERIANAFDPNMSAGAMTPRSSGIRAAVSRLGDSGLVSPAQAAAAMQQATDKPTGAALSSSGE